MGLRDGAPEGPSAADGTRIARPRCMQAGRGCGVGCAARGERGAQASQGKPASLARVYVHPRKGAKQCDAEKDAEMKLTA